jgi:hypothetical protein
MTIYGGPEIVTSGLVLHLDAANTKSYTGTGTTWTDLSGNGNNGTLTNGPTYTSNYMGGIVLDGVNDYVVMSTASSVPIEGPGTLDVWGSYGAVSSTYNLIALSLATAGIQVGILSGNGIVWKYGGNTLLTYTKPTINTIANWTLTFNGANLIMYINGILNNSTTTAANQTGSSPIIRLGTYNSGASQPLNGTIYASRIYNRVLTASEVLQNYNALKGRYGL